MIESNKKIRLPEIKDIYKCYECGKCTGVCPLNNIMDFTPRIIVENWLFNLEYDKLSNDIWSCLTCASCMTVCPMDVNFIEFIRIARTEFIKKGYEFEESHFGIFSSIARLQIKNIDRGKGKQNLYKGLKIRDKGPILFWTGCTPFFELALQKPYTDISVNSVRILNYVGVEPVILDNEKCCGHDLYWNGDLNNFKKLAEYNVKSIEETGAKLVITSCPECYRTFKIDYPKYVGKLNFDVISFSEFIELKIKSNELMFNYDFPYKITYHDPCRLGRHLKIYEPPRNILKIIPGIKFKEMPRNRENAQCCGISNWNCSLLKKSLRIDRIEEANDIADYLITTCPKCKIHFECLLDEDIKNNTNRFKIKVIDLPTFIAKALFII